MEIIHLSAECYPVAKAGGLGDVVGALPKYQNKAGHIAKVVMPMYHTKFIQNHEFTNEHEADFDMGPMRFHYRVMKERHNSLGFNLYLIDIPGLFDREGIYSYQDDTERFVGFQIAALDWIAQWQHRPDVIHCHDHHTGLVPFLLYNTYKYQHLQGIKSVLTIHNGLYQGWMPWSKSNLLPTFDTWKSGLLDWNNMINPLASAVRCAHVITTVSQSYLHELMESANGLEKLFRQHYFKSKGIINGIDTEVWNPVTDKYINFNYDSENVHDGKLQNKRELCSIFGLDPNKPLICFIGRAVSEKGADLLPQAIGKALKEVNGACNFLILGSGDKQIERNFEGLKHYFSDNYNCFIGYNEELSHKMYAGADFLLMPSRVEPCGLNQLYCLRYGTIPMVRSTGGLQDTVRDFGDEGGFGIRFTHASSRDIVMSVHRAVQLYYDHNDYFQLMRKHSMHIDHSWESANKQYSEIYK